MVVVTKSLSLDFPGGSMITRQFRIILSNAFTIFDTISVQGDTIEICFTRELTVEELGELDDLISNYVIDPSYYITNSPNMIIFPSDVTNTSFKDWTVIKTFVFPGTLKVGIPQDVEAIVNIDDGATSGSLRLYDFTNHCELFQYNNITNTVPMTIEMDPGNFWPKNQALLEIQMKVVTSQSSKKVNFSYLNIEFNIQ